MLSAFANCLKIPDLRKRIFFTLAMVFVCRLIDVVPVPGIDGQALQKVFSDIEKQTAGGFSFLSWIDLFSGGALGRFALGTLSIWPYITASIIIQMMTALVPALEKLAREGDVGRQKISQYTRYFTLVICLVQGYVISAAMENTGFLKSMGINAVLVTHPGPMFRIMSSLAMTTGTMLMMWLGEQISERGIGNGISIIITANIVNRLPSAVFSAIQMFTRHEAGQAQFSIFYLVGMLVLIAAVISGTILLTVGQRKIPIHTAKRVVGRKVYGGQTSYMPLRVNYSGVMPIIFAQALLQFPAQIMISTKIEVLKNIGQHLANGNIHLLAYGVLILFFSYFWVATQFNPLQIADDLKKNGGYVPGIRPGKPTAEFLDKTMTRITLIGALGLTLIAVIPQILYDQVKIPWVVAQFFGGTSLLIIVGVALDTMRQLESHLLMRHYDGFLSKGRLRGRR